MTPFKSDNPKEVQMYGAELVIKDIPTDVLKEVQIKEAILTALDEWRRLVTK